MRVTKGSQHEIQEYIMNHSGEFVYKIWEQTDINITEWKSPIVEENYEEYVDESFRDLPMFQKITKAAWSEFWPKRGGPKWDGIALTGNPNEVILVECNSYPDELLTKMGAKSPKNLKIIKNSFDKYLKPEGILYENEKGEIESRYYQLLNRIAFIKFLNSQGISAKLLMINFFEDPTQEADKIVDEETFRRKTKKMEEELHIPEAMEGLYFAYIKGIR